MFKRKKKDKEVAEGEEKKEEAEEKKEEAKEEPKEEAKEGEAKEGEEGAEGEGAPKKGKKKLIIIVGAVVLIGVIFGGLFASGILGGKKEEPKEDAATQAVINKPVYYELPEFLVNLSSTNNRASFLKMQVTLELRDQAAVAVVEANKPRIIDTFNTYLRELRAQDVQGSAGIYRLRDELLSRINGTVQEGLVKDILFSEIIVQ